MANLEQSRLPAQSAQKSAPAMASSVKPEANGDSFSQILNSVQWGDGKSGLTTEWEKKMYQYLQDNKSLFKNWNVDQVKKYIEELRLILQKYQGDASNIRVLCEISLRKLRNDIPQYTKTRASFNNFLNHFRDHSVVLSQSNGKSNDLGVIEMSANYLTSVVDSGWKEQNQFIEYLKSHSADGNAFLEAWKKPNNPIRHFLRARGADGARVIQIFDERIKVEVAKMNIGSLDSSEEKTSFFQHEYSPKKLKKQAVLESAVNEIINLQKSPDGKKKMWEAQLHNPDLLRSFLVNWNDKNPLYIELKKKSPDTFGLMESLRNEYVRVYSIPQSLLSDSNKLDEYLRGSLPTMIEQDKLKNSGKLLNDKYKKELTVLFTEIKAAIEKWSLSDEQKANYKQRIENTFSQYETKFQFISQNLGAQGEDVRKTFNALKATKESSFKHILGARDGYAAQLNNLIGWKSDATIKVVDGATEAFFAALKGEIKVMTFKESGVKTQSLEACTEEIKQKLLRDGSTRDVNSKTFATFLKIMYDQNGQTINFRILSEKLGPDATIKLIAFYSQTKDSKAIQELWNDSRSRHLVASFRRGVVDGMTYYKKINERLKNQNKEIISTISEMVPPERRNFVAIEVKRICDQMGNKNGAQILLEIQRVLIQNKVHIQNAELYEKITNAAKESAQEACSVSEEMLDSFGKETYSRHNKQKPFWKLIAKLDEEIKALKQKKNLSKEEGVELKRLERIQLEFIIKMENFTISGMAAHPEVLDLYQKELARLHIPDTTIFPGVSATQAAANLGRSSVRAKEFGALGRNQKAMHSLVAIGAARAQDSFQEAEKLEANFMQEGLKIHKQAKIEAQTEILVKHERARLEEKYGTANEEELKKIVSTNLERGREIYQIVSVADDAHIRKTISETSALAREDRTSNTPLKFRGNIASPENILSMQEGEVYRLSGGAGFVQKASNGQLLFKDQGGGIIARFEEKEQKAAVSVFSVLSEIGAEFLLSNIRDILSTHSRINMADGESMSNEEIGFMLESISRIAGIDPGERFNQYRGKSALGYVKSFMDITKGRWVKYLLADSNIYDIQKEQINNTVLQSKLKILRKHG